MSGETISVPLSKEQIRLIAWALDEMYFVEGDQLMLDTARSLRELAGIPPRD